MNKLSGDWKGWRTSRIWRWQGRSRRKEGWWDYIILEPLDKRAWIICLSWWYSGLEKLKTKWLVKMAKGTVTANVGGPMWVPSSKCRKLTSMKSSKTRGSHCLWSPLEFVSRPALRSTSSCSNAGHVPGINNGVSPMSTITWTLYRSNGLRYTNLVDSLLAGVHQIKLGP